MDHALQPAIKDLLNKAQRSPTQIVLPRDFVAGPAAVTVKGGVEPPPSQEQDDDEDDEDDEDEDEDEDEDGGMSQGGLTGAASAGQSTALPGEEEEEDEEDPAAGMEYDYEVGR